MKKHSLFTADWFGHRKISRQCSYLSRLPVAIPVLLTEEVTLVIYIVPSGLIENRRIDMFHHFLFKGLTFEQGLQPRQFTENVIFGAEKVILGPDRLYMTSHEGLANTI